MEDIRKRAEFSNVAIQIQAVEKLVRDVKKKLPKGGNLSASTAESPELTSLWQYTSVPQHAVARRTCQMWVELLKEGVAEFTYVINGFLNQVPTARNLQGIVEGVCQLLVLQVLVTEKAGENYVCPYTIRSPPHPLVTIATYRPGESWPVILEQISEITMNGQLSVREQALSILDPFLKFILLDPKCNEQHATLRSTLKVRLIDLVSQTQESTLRNSQFSYLLDILDKQQVSSFQGVAETSQFCYQLLHAYRAQQGNQPGQQRNQPGQQGNQPGQPGNQPASKQGSLDAAAGRKLCRQALSLCLKCQQNNLSFGSLAKLLLAVARQEPEVLVQQSSLAILSHLLLESYPSDSRVLLDLVRTFLKCSSIPFSPVAAGFVAMATINVMATPGDISSGDPSSKFMVGLASEVLSLMEAHLQTTADPGQEEDGGSDQMAPDLYDIQTWVQLGNQLWRDPTRLRHWLTQLKANISSQKTISWSLTNLLVSILLTPRDTALAKLTVERLADIAAQDTAKAPALLPVFLYSLGKKTCPSLRLYLMETLPRLATHKFAVPAVLKTILSLGQSPKLKALSVRLLTQLWAHQDRCFSHLLKAITDGGRGPVTMATVTDEVTLAKAFAVKEVCRLRPEQHGAEMLSPLSDILNTCSDERSGAAASLAMEALFYICQAEVIDIMSAWKVLEPTLVAEERVPVVEKICDLLSLVPGLQVKTDEYEVFLSEMARRLWLYTRTDCVAVVTAAYRALSSYSMEHFKLSHFQFQIVEEFVTQAQTTLAQEGNEGLTLDSVMPVVPGVTYTRLMNTVDQDALKGFETFLCSMVGKEVESLPRGIYRTSLRQHGASANQGKAVGTIPKFIQNSYEKMKQPGLRPGLAAGLLFCYDPPVEVGRDGRPRKHYLLSHGKNYRQMLDTLLHDIPVQPSEWHRMMLMPQAWSVFMEKLFSSMVEARSAEIDLQLKRDFISETEADEMKAAAWLWVRDTVVGVIKRATTGNPSIQGNAILALAGLTMAVQRLVTGLEKAERKRADDITTHTSHAHWLMMVMDSLMSLVDNEYQPKSTLLGLCQQRAVDDRLPASVLAQATAILALSQIVPIIVSHYTELAYTLMTKLSERLPGQPKSEDCPQVLHMFHGLGLGMLLSKLVQESFPDLTGSKGSLAVMSAFDHLEECCFSATEHRSGAMLGLGVGLAALCRDGKIESRVHVSSMHARMTELLRKTPVSDTVFQPLCYALATVTGTGFVSNALDIDKVNNVLDLLTSLHGNNKENQGLSLSLGLVCHSLSLGSHPNIDKQKQPLHDDWLEIVSKGDHPPTERLAALAGLMALVGSENSVQRIDGDFSATSGDLKIDKVIVQACHVISASDHVGIQGSASWLLGNLYMSLCTTNTSSSTVPVTYQYLQESSVMRYTVDFLIQAGKQGPEQVPSRHVEICLAALQEEVTGSLPPLNWTGVLSPLMKLPFSERVKLLCVKLTIKMCSTSTTAALFLSSWIVPPLFTTLPDSCQGMILEAGEQLIKTVAPSVLQTFFDRSCTEVFLRQSQDRQLCGSVLKGVNSALGVADPPEAVVAMMYKFVRELFQHMKAEKDPYLLSGLAKCLGHLPDIIFDDLTSGDCVDADTVIRGTFVRSALVGHGKQPIALLNSCIDAAFNIQCDKTAVLCLLVHTFARMTTVESKNTRIMARAQWLLEIMGHVRNITTGTVQLTNAGADLREVTSFALDIIAAAVCSWIGQESAATFGLTSELLDMDDLPDQSGISPLESHIDTRPFDQLRNHIQQLNKDPWNQLVPKVLDWLLAMRDLPEAVVTRDRKIVMNSCLSSLRHSGDFAKFAVWTKAVMC